MASELFHPKEGKPFQTVRLGEIYFLHSTVLNPALLEANYDFNHRTMYHECIALPEVKSFGWIDIDAKVNLFEIRDILDGNIDFPAGPITLPINRQSFQFPTQISFEIEGPEEYLEKIQTTLFFRDKKYKLVFTRFTSGFAIDNDIEGWISIGEPKYHDEKSGEVYDTLLFPSDENVLKEINLVFSR